ncbi:unnamed protein product (mitochondrion) [Plasmodiophora brassicae]|uniref:Uncharacterized protein n=1 Tax=Plasmodiophora brassicae TaxID=37360 RepID=A0A3P3Y7B2_PLABS|nr:unnamed protein product [Plasmodiophora brassicae]
MLRAGAGEPGCPTNKELHRHVRGALPTMSAAEQVEELQRLVRDDDGSSDRALIVCRAVSDANMPGTRLDSSLCDAYSALIAASTTTARLTLATADALRFVISRPDDRREFGAISTAAAAVVSCQLAHRVPRMNAAAIVYLCNDSSVSTAYPFVDVPGVESQGDEFVHLVLIRAVITYGTSDSTFLSATFPHLVNVYATSPSCSSLRRTAIVTLADWAQRSVDNGDDVIASLNRLLDVVIECNDGDVCSAYRRLLDIIFHFDHRHRPEDAARLRRVIQQGTKAHWLIASRLVYGLGAKTAVASCPALIGRLLQCAGDPHVWSEAKLVFERVTVDTFAVVPQEQWLAPMLSILTDSTGSLPSRIAKDNLHAFALPVLVRVAPRECWAAVFGALRDSDTQAAVDSCFAVAGTLRRCGVRLGNIGLADEEVIKALSSGTEQTRLTVLAFVCLSPQIAELPSTRECDLVQACLHALRSPTLSSVRNRVAFLMKAFLARIKNGTWRSRKERRLHPASPFDSDDSDDDCVVAEHFRFVRWLLKSSAENLYRGASLDRLLMNLQLIQIVTDTFNGSWRDTFVGTRVLSTLSSFITPVRSLASSILLRVASASPIPGLERPSDLRPVITSVLARLTSAIPSEATAAAQTLHVLFTVYVQRLRWTILVTAAQIAVERTEDNIDEFIGNLADMVSRQTRLAMCTPLADRYRIENERSYGALCALTFVVESLPRLSEDCASVVADVARTCLDVALEAHISESVAVDCRGHVILDEDDADSGDDESRIVVVQSWQIIKQSCSLLVAITTVTHNPSLINDIGLLILKILRGAKHQGIITRAFQSLEALCAHVLALDQGAGFVNAWLDTLLDVLQSGETSRLAWIRRSAGVPFCYRAILRAEIRKSPHCRTMSRRVMSTIMSIIRTSPEWEARVLALNVLRAVLGDGVLSVHLVSYIPDAMRFALSGFTSTHWAIRNASLMLFTTIARNQDLGPVRAQIRIVLLDELAQLSPDTSHPGLYPVLLMVSRMSRSPAMTPFVPLVEQCSRHHILMLRHMAARAMLPCCMDPMQRLVALLRDHLPPKHRLSSISSNALHGLVLQMIALSGDLDDGQRPPADLVQSRLYLTGSAMTCPTVRREAMSAFWLLVDTSSLNALVSTLLRSAVDASERPPNGIGARRLLGRAAKLIIHCLRFVSDKDERRALVAACSPAVLVDSIPDDVDANVLHDILQCCLERGMSFVECLPIIDRSGARLTEDQCLAVRSVAERDPIALRLVGRCPTSALADVLPVVSQAAAPCKSVDMRLAACVALLRLRQDRVEIDDTSASVFWTTALRLLQDESGTVRDAAEALVPVIDTNARVHTTLERLFLYLMRDLSHCTPLHVALWEMLMTLANVSDGVSANVVYVPDRDNDFMEPVLLAQLLASLIHAVVSMGTPLAGSWRSEAEKAIVDVVSHVSNENTSSASSNRFHALDMYQVDPDLAPLLDSPADVTQHLFLLNPLSQCYPN